MMPAVVFSKDRALQLDGCLESFWRHVKDAALVRLHVLFAASGPRHQAQYLELARSAGDRAEFIPEADFRRQVIALLNESPIPVGHGGRPGPMHRLAGLFGKPNRGEEFQSILFLVDDCVFVRDVKLAAAQAALGRHPDALGFSLRLGRNTTSCYVLDRTQTLPDFESCGDSVLKFRWDGADGDFGYPLEISSSLYRLFEIRTLIRGLRFRDPNTFESQLSLRARERSNRQPFLLSGEISSAFSVPLNRVQAVYANRSGSAPDWSTESMAAKFDQGLRINTRALDGFVPTGVHQEVEFDLQAGDERHAAG